MTAAGDTPKDERLEQLEEKIDAARRHAEQADDIGPGGMFTDTEPAFHESGDFPEEDDQTIAPPG